MRKKSTGTQLEMKILGAHTQVEQGQEKADNLIDVRQYKIQAHTRRVMEKLRTEGLVRDKDRK